MRQPIRGIQIHHSVFLDDSMRGATNAQAGLQSAFARTCDPAILLTLERLNEVSKEIARHRNEAQARLRAMPTDEVVRARNGELPWPDELAEGFEPRCSCHDRCLVHDTGLEGDDRHCNCDKPCPAHD